MQTYLFFKRIAIKLYIIYLVVDNKIYERDSKNIKVTFSVILSNFFAPISQILEVLNLLSWRYHWLLRKRIFERWCKENLVVFTAALIILLSFQTLNNMRYIFFVDECVKGIGKTWQKYPFSRAVFPSSRQIWRMTHQLTHQPPTHPDEVVPASYPDVSLSMKMCAQRKAGRRQRVSDVCTLPMVTCASSPVTRVSRSSLANEAPEEQADFV